ncbi:MAG: patatin-like phospholipase family protein [Saprospiraceae bacterium]|nr:patatin-like phospholipase family protein [Saprospiraceae bacterium]MCF8252888.1 patatin-like phospholipase family protein [Saprospiraceae bacterium]MCF8314434.1 patatin-like phospholipase family protein [Saprospiraceae bacterium]
MRKKLTDILFSFPFQLLVLHLRSNLLLIGVWLLLALVITGKLGGQFGLRYLFLSPEYMGEVGFISFFFVGVGYGGLVMSWNLTTYLLDAYRFSFLASLGKPFAKFVLNNLVVPVAFTLLFLVCQIRFGLLHELQPLGEVLWNSAGFLVGFIMLVLALALYFQFTNKDITSFSNKGKKKKKDPANNQVVKDIRQHRNQWRVDTFLSDGMRPRPVRSVAHYDPAFLAKIFQQNHLNALLVQLVIMVLIVLLGALIDHAVFRIPTGASIFLLSSTVIAVGGAISFWLGTWRITGMFAILILLNFITRIDFFHHKNKAYGLNFEVPPSPYNLDSLQNSCTQAAVDTDIATTLEILEKWKLKAAGPNGEKPKMVFFCVSGGGLKAASWAMEILQHADSLTNGQFLEHTVLMSGASGGMMGTSYYRELALLRQQGEPIDLYDRQHVADISKDLLNPISFTIVTNDIFLPWANFEQGGQRYKKDRGYIFEKAFNENTHDRLNKTIAEYAEPEREALIPMMFITPSIVNDGRRMVISSQPVRYMMVEPAGVKVPGSIRVDAVDFRHLFAAQNADSLRFTTALRMNATYPYVLPNVNLPSEPRIEVLDAGFRDNFGLKSATRFMHVFKDWIRENTSGTVVVVVRSFERQQVIKSNENRGILETLLNPLEIAFKVMSLQDYEHDNNLGFLYDLLGPDMLEIVRLTYHPSEDLKDSPISFYITNRERADLRRAIGSEESVQSLRRLQELLH